MNPSSKGLRVLFFRPPMRNGAPYFRYQQYAEFLKQRGAQLRIVPPNPKGERWMKKLLLFPWRLARSLPAFFWADQVVLSPAPNMFWILLFFRLLGKKVILEHYVSYVSHREVIPRFPAWLDRWSFQLVDHVITHTQQMKMEISSEHRLHEGRVTALYCAVDLQHFRPEPAQETETLRQSLGLGNRFVVFYHGMHHTWHGLSYLLQAGRLLESESEIVFVLLPRSGLPAFRNVVYIEEEQPFEKLPAYLALADLWCSGFVSEPRGDRTFSSTMIQALAMGLPVITSPTPEKSRWMTHGKNVLFVEPRNAEKLAATIREACHLPDRLREIGQSARRTAERLFSLADTETHLESIFGLPASAPAVRVPAVLA